MDCVNHPGANVTAYCQSCGKALCANCVRNAPGGQILCESCWTGWQSFQQPFVPPPQGAPSPAAAAALGLIPGVGAMYNGQFVKGLFHVVIFAVLVSAAHVYDIFGLFIAAWIFYQSFEAYHTARARRDGLPLPDPLGLNDLASVLGSGKQQTPGVPNAGPGANASTSQAAGYQAPYQQAPYTPPYQPPAPPDVPPIPPVPPPSWRRKEPIGAIVLIGFGVLLLLGQLNLLSGRLMEYTWPLLLIGLGVWLVVRRLEETKGGLK
jgi:hypothetical protein